MSVHEAPGPDREAIDHHRSQVVHLILPMVARYEFGELAATPEGRELLAASPELRASVAITALAGPRSGNTAAIVTEVPWSDQWPAELVRELNRRKIAWAPAAAALALRLVAARDFDDERVHLVLKAADQIAESHPAHPDVMDGLDRLRARLEVTATDRYRVPELRARVVATIARHSPPEVLDLSPVAETDTWGPAARAVLRAADDDGVDVTALLRCLSAAPASSDPTARWLATVDATIADDRRRDVVRSLARLLVDLRLVPARNLVDPGNDVLARAAVWSLGRGGGRAADVDLLVRIALRCSRTNGKPYVTDALCGKAAGAAVSTLGRLRAEGGEAGDPAAAGLEALWRDVERGDVLRRVGRALGRTPDEITGRVRAAQQAKASVRRPRSG